MNMMGAKFSGHPSVQYGNVTKMTDHYVTAHMPHVSRLREEFYNFDKVPENKMILLQMDESSYEGGNMGDVHPIAWCSDKTPRLGRMCYHGLGHEPAMFNNTDFVETIKRMVLWGSEKVLES